MTPLPTHPDEVQRIADAVGKKISHRFSRTRWGWHVSTTYGIGHLEGGIWAWTLTGAQRKAARLARRLREDERQTFEVVT